MLEVMECFFLPKTLKKLAATLRVSLINSSVFGKKKPSITTTTGNGMVLCPATFFGRAQRIFPGQRRKAPELFRRHRGLRRGCWRKTHSIVTGKNNNWGGTQTNPVTNSLDVIAGSVALVGATRAPLWRGKTTIRRGHKPAPLPTVGD